MQTQTFILIITLVSTGVVVGNPLNVQSLISVVSTTEENLIEEFGVADSLNLITVQDETAKENTDRLVEHFEIEDSERTQSQFTTERSNSETQEDNEVESETKGSVEDEKSETTTTEPQTGATKKQSDSESFPATTDRSTDNDETSTVEDSDQLDHTEIDIEGASAIAALAALAANEASTALPTEMTTMIDQAGTDEGNNIPASVNSNHLFLTRIPVPAIMPLWELGSTKPTPTTTSTTMRSATRHTFPPAFWLPNLRGVRIDYPASRIRDLAVQTPSTRGNGFLNIKRPKRRDPEGSGKVKTVAVCADPEARLTFGFIDGSQKLVLEDSTERLSRKGFRITEAKVEGSCCWELFDEVGFLGSVLRLCPGNYDDSILGRYSDDTKSVRAVDHFAKIKKHS